MHLWEKLFSDNNSSVFRSNVFIVVLQGTNPKHLMLTIKEFYFFLIVSFVLEVSKHSDCLQCT